MIQTGAIARQVSSFGQLHEAESTQFACEAKQRGQVFFLARTADLRLSLSAHHLVAVAELLHQVDCKILKLVFVFYLQIANS